MLGLVDALMYRAPDYVRDHERLVNLAFADNYVVYRTVAKRMHSVDVAAGVDVAGLSLGDGANAIGVRAECVTDSFFTVLGTPISTGRGFSPADNTEGAEPALVLSDDLWRRAFAARTGIVGERLAIGRRTFSVIGVAPPGFRGLSSRATDIWIPVAASPALCSFTGGNLLWSTRAHWLSTFGRLRDNLTAAQANAELVSLRDAIEADLGDAPRDASRTTRHAGFRDRRAQPDSTSRVALWLAAGAMIVLLIASANVAGLLSLRAVDRRREITVRLQLGGTRARLITQLVIENLVLAAFCGVAAIAVATALGHMLQDFFPIVSGRSLLDSRALTILWACALISGLLSAIVPALQVPPTPDIAQSRGGRQMVAGRSRVRTVLVVAQLAPLADARRGNRPLRAQRGRDSVGGRLRPRPRAGRRPQSRQHRRCPARGCPRGLQRHDRPRQARTASGVGRPDFGRRARTRRRLEHRDVAHHDDERQDTRGVAGIDRYAGLARLLCHPRPRPRPRTYIFQRRRPGSNRGRRDGRPPVAGRRSNRQVRVPDARVPSGGRRQPQQAGRGRHS